MVPDLNKRTMGPTAVAADSLDFAKIYLHPIYVNKEKGFKLVKVQTAVDDPNPLRILFGNQPGNIPIKFGVETNMHGKTFLTFAVPCDLEAHALLQFQDAAKDYAKQHKDTWWVYPVSDNQIEDNFAGIISARKEKKEGGGFWPGNVKVHVPLDENGEIKECTIIDEDGQPLSFRDLPGRKWSNVLIEISGIYFQNRFNWGFGPKTLRLVRTVEDATCPVMAVHDVDFLELANTCRPHAAGRNKRDRAELSSAPSTGLTADAFHEFLDAQTTKRQKVAVDDHLLVPPEITSEPTTCETMCETTTTLIDHVLPLGLSRAPCEPIADRSTPLPPSPSLSLSLSSLPPLR